MNGVSRAISSVVEIGKNIVSGLWQGIQSMGQWIQDKIGSLFRSVINGAKVCSVFTVLRQCLPTARIWDSDSVEGYRRNAIR